MVGIHLHLAAAADAYATARMSGHPVIALVVGTALSGGFLAHGLQADRILALDDPGVEIHAMHKPAAARITRRTVAELEQLATRVPPLSYDVRDWATLGLCDGLLQVADADHPTSQDVATVRAELAAAVGRARRGDHSLALRWSIEASGENRAATRRVWAAMTDAVGMTSMRPRVHDLIRFDAERARQTRCRTGSPATARMRGPSSGVSTPRDAGMVAAGVRGRDRAERAAIEVDAGAVLAIVSPESLISADASGLDSAGIADALGAIAGSELFADIGGARPARSGSSSPPGWPRCTPRATST